ncbi:hypothetical protein [Frigidibacter sp. ROC022]|uniref:hypothetical protein n=1 Tax=Frigidibacter sp. ROC022 TaxID=2971796 RepID=UPI00215A67CC|nr:hypothetical protein [Frigidibacter sp. ROC022]MCR8726775.1 hypothetical protein [Frigidibacter sp. ROC022]
MCFDRCVICWLGLEVGKKMRRSYLLSAGFGLVCAVAMQGGALFAATVDMADEASPGAPVGQRFLEDGSSIVATPDQSVCLVNRRIVIETSDYRAPNGDNVPFERIIRSIAASVQAVAGAEGPTGFRIQLKYSPRPGAPIRLSLGDETIDVTGQLEPSTDSLWLDGTVAERMVAAFAAGEEPVLVAISGDTGRTVTDRLPAPDLAALENCQTVLAAEARPVVAPSSAIRATFLADPETTPLATLEDLRTCGMTDPPGRLHLAHLQSVTGFVSQTDKIFVAFDDEGRMTQAYVPGIFDADFRDGAHKVRISRAADGNVPAVENGVKGCLGARSVELCSYELAGGEHLIGACAGALSELLLEDPGQGNKGGAAAPLLALLGAGPGKTAGGGGGLYGGGGGSGSTGGGTVDPGDPPSGGDPGGELSPVPVPAPLPLLAGSLLGLAALVRRRRVGEAASTRE